MADRQGPPLPWELPLGAAPDGDGWTTFRVWAPRAGRVEVALGGGTVPLVHAGGGVHEGRLRARAGDDYRFVLDGGDTLPDPCSRHQPEGVRGPSRIVDPAAFEWSDAGWAGLDPDAPVVYELHVGTFTPEGTFAAAAGRLAELRELGVTAVELMPVATFPGARNWGYDGLYGWAPHPVYGGPEGLTALVDAAHASGLGVILDVVYNHVGPGAEALEAFGPYLAEGCATPWGPAPNFDGPDCGGVREWAIQGACMWLRDYRLDGLRVDAVHAVRDGGAHHLLAELCERARSAARWPPVLIAESDLNDPRVVRTAEAGGWGFDCQWADDFHHALHALLTGESGGRYADFGTVADLAAATRRPFVYEGGYAPSRRRRHGAPAGDLAPRRFVVCSQNHDQVGNRPAGDRPPPETRALAALWVLLAPFVPMLFMGEEHGEEHPFQFFTDHIDPAIAAAAREGRRRELADTGLAGEPPDPQDPVTRSRSVIDPSAGDPALRDLYRRLLALRRRLAPGAARVRHDEPGGWVAMRRGDVEAVGNFRREATRVPVRAAELVLSTDPGAALADGGLRLPPLSGAVVR